MTDLQALSAELREQAKAGLVAFDEAWKEGGIPLALERHGEAVIRAQVQYQACVDLDAVLRGVSTAEDLELELKRVATEGPAIQAGRMTSLVRQVAQEEAQAILRRLQN